MRLLDQVGGVRRHPQGALGLLVGDVVAPAQRLLVEVLEVLELARHQEVRLEVGKRSLDTGLPIGVIDPVGAELEAERAGKRRHLRRHDRIRARSGGEDDGGVVDDADLRSALHEAHRFQQE